MSTLDNLNHEVITITAVTDNSLVSRSVPIIDLETKYVTDAADYLKNISGFSVIRHGGTNNDFIFRGMSGSQMHILVDTGEIIGACLSRMDPATSYIAPETFDILNFIKGPQTVLWGPVVSGGVVQFRRYHPSFNLSDIKLRSNVTIGSFNSIKRNIDTIFGSKYGYIRLIGNCDRSDDYRDANNDPIHSAWYKWNFDSILSFNVQSNTYLEINLGQGNGNANYMTKPMDGLCFSRESYGLKLITADINDVLNEIEFQTWYHHIHHIMIDNIISRSSKSMLLTSNKRCCCNSNISDVDRVLWGGRSVIVCQWKNFQWFSGMDIQINQHKRKTGFSYNDQIDAVSKDSGIFTEFIFNDLLNKKIIGGIRLEYSTIDAIDCYDIHFRHNLLYPAGFIRYEHNISPSWLYYYGIGTCCRFPDYWEFISIQQFYKNKTNSIFQLKPEKTIQIDAGTYFQKCQITGWISSYAGYVKDFIYYHYNDANLIQKNNIIDCLKNVRASICGSEMGLSYQFNDHWHGESNISWPWGWNMNDKCVLSTISPLEGRFICQFKQKHYKIGASLRLVSSSQYITNIASFMFPSSLLSKKLINSDYTPGFGVMSMYASWQTFQYCICSIGVDNLFNRNYKEYINTFNHDNISIDSNVVDVVYEPGRTWWIKIGVSF